MDEITIGIVDLSINQQDTQPNTQQDISYNNQPQDKYIKYLINVTFINCLRSTNKYIRYPTISGINIILFGDDHIYWF